MALFAIVAAGAVTIVAVALIVLALVVYLISIILELRKINAGLNEVMGGVSEMVRKSAPVNGVVTTINEHLDAGVDLLEGLLVKKAGLEDAVGLVDGLYPGSAAAGFRNFPESRTTQPPRIGEVYTKGTLTLARLGREAPIAAGSPAGPALRDAGYGSAAAAKLYPEARQARPASFPRSPVVGTGAPIQYGPSPPDAISWGRTAPEAQAPSPPDAISWGRTAPEAQAPSPPDAISWRRAAPEAPAPAPEPPQPAAPEPQQPAAPDPQPAAPDPQPAAPEPKPATPDAPRNITWKRR
ncbi:MAG: DUF948 domain-containing protein [Actinomycetota bacterium]|nr:DUF948 domain-containing protein [Actinomycetota bacterium]